MHVFICEPIFVLVLIYFSSAASGMFVLKKSEDEPNLQVSVQKCIIKFCCYHWDSSVWLDYGYDHGDCAQAAQNFWWISSTSYFKKENHDFLLIENVYYLYRLQNKRKEKIRKRKRLVHCIFILIVKCYIKKL